MMPFLNNIGARLTPHLTIKHLIIAGLFLIIVAAFWLGGWPGGDDWAIYYTAAQRLLTRGAPIYGEPLTETGYYYNPPWLAASLMPFAVLPIKLAWSIISAITLAGAFFLLRRWEPRVGLIKIIAVMVSPPMLYTLLHGQVDMLVISGIWLPQAFWPVIALTKPQVAIGLAFGVPRPLWIRAILVSGGFLLLSFVLWGFWPSQAFGQPTPFIYETHNLWFGLWPMQVPAGIMLILLGISRQDERLLIAASPIVSPYAPTSSMLGPWIAAVTYLRPWQVAIVLATWWAAVIFRGARG